MPITREQRPEQERMKKLAQEEQEQAPLQMSLGQLQFFVQRETDMEIANQYGLPITRRSSAVPRSTHVQRRSGGRDLHPPAPAPALSQITLSCLIH